MEKEIKELFLETHIKMLEAQLRAVKKLKSGDKKEKQRRTGRSQIEYVYDILVKAKKELHISEIIELAEKTYRIHLDRESLVSALTKKVLKGDRFIRTGKNTFALKENK